MLRNKLLTTSSLVIVGLISITACNSDSDNVAHDNDDSHVAEQVTADGPITFTEAQDAAGIDFIHLNDRRDSLIPEDVGSGCGWADYDNDGDEDLFLINFAGPFLMEPEDVAKRDGNKLYRNNGDGSFTDVTNEAGLSDSDWNYACLWWDANNDGWLDVTVTHYGGAKHYQNNGDGTFLDQTDASGLGEIDSFLLGLTAGDYDKDGDLDVYLCGYVEFDRVRARDERPLVAGRPAVWTNPVSYDALPNILLNNDGNGVFTDVTEAAGVTNPTGKSMQAIFCDFNNDSYPDLYVGNDVGTADAMFKNNGDGTFEDVSSISGTVDPRASMGLAVGDVYHNGGMDLFSTHWVNEDHALWKNQASGEISETILMEDVAPFTGILEIKSTADVGWGVDLVDFDNDGHLDIVLANGSTIEDELTTEVLKDPKLLPQESKILRNNGEVHFDDVSESAGAFFHKALVTRGLATADYDQDGKMDIAVILHSGKATLLKNTSKDTGNYLRVKLSGTASNRYGIGARIQVKTSVNTYTHESVLSSSYLSTNSTIAHFGLGTASEIDSVTVTWPNGNETAIESPEINSLLTVKEIVSE